MANLILPHIIQNATAADAAQVEQNFSITRNFINSEVVHRDGAVAMTGQLKLVGDPVNVDDAVRKGYADNIIPVGVVMPYAGAAAPPGGVWALANGASVSTTAFPDLFALCGYRYGGSGGNFNLPNLRGRVPVGQHPTVGIFDATGKTGGQRNAAVIRHRHDISHPHSNTLAVANGSAPHTHSTPNHTHPGHAHNTPNDTPHGQTFLTRLTGYTGASIGIATTAAGTEMAVRFEASTASANTPSGGSGTTGGASGSNATHGHNMTGSVTAHSGLSAFEGEVGTDLNLQPYLVLQFIIKVK